MKYAREICLSVINSENDHYLKWTEIFQEFLLGMDDVSFIV